MCRCQSVSSTVASIVSLSLLSACNAGSISGPSPVDAVTTGPVFVQLQAPAKLRGQWATSAIATSVPANHNVVILLPNYSKDNPEALAREFAERRLPLIVFAGHIYHNNPGSWAQAWTYFDQYLRPFREAGVLVGIQPLDEPAHHAQWPLVAPAVADVRARGYRVLLTEVIQYVDESGYNLQLPPGVDWFHVTCYPYPQTRWTLETCTQEYNEHPEWDVAVLDTSWSDAPSWVQMAESKGRGWLLWVE